MDTHTLNCLSPKQHISKEQSISKNTDNTNSNERSTKNNIIIISSTKKNSKYKFISKYEKAKTLYLKQYQNYFQKKLVIKYNILPNEYKLMKIDNFITAKYCRDLAIFKENLIYNYDEEFLKRYYLMKESVKKIPLFSDFYKSYLTFFCTPTLTELALNELIEGMVEKKAKVFYKENFKEEDEKSKTKVINTVIFTNKIRNEISRRNTLTNLTKTTIKNNITSKSSKSLLTIGIIFNELNNDDKKNNNNLSFTLKYNDDNNKENIINEAKSVSNKNNSIINKKKKINKNSLYEMSEKLNINKSKKLLKTFKINKNTENSKKNIYENNINIININSNNNKINIIQATNDIIHKNYITNNNNNNNIFNEIPKNRHPIAQVIKTINKVKQQQNLKPIIKFNSKLLRQPTDISAPISERIFTSIKNNEKLGGSSSNNKNQNLLNIKHPLSILSSYTNGAHFCKGEKIKIKSNHSKSSYSNKNKKKIETNKKKKTISSRNNKSSIGAVKSITNGSDILSNINNTSRIVKQFATTVSFQTKSIPKNNNNKIIDKVKERNIDSGNKNNEGCHYKKISNKVIICNSKINDNKRKNYNLKSINNTKCISSNKLILSSYNKSKIASMSKNYINNNKNNVIDYQNYNNSKINNTLVSDSQKILKKIKGIIKNKK